MPAPDNRPVLSHPPRGIPRYLSGSVFDKLDLSLPGHGKSARLTAYEAFARSKFAAVPDGLTSEDLVWLAGYVGERLAIEKEERRMHFGAFALVCVLFFLLLPHLFLQDLANATLNLVALLLFLLIVPYVFVYFDYENRVRAMMAGRLRVLEAVEARRGRTGALDSGAGQG